MNVRPSILCPVDYSPSSAGALQYAAAIAERFVTRLIVLAVAPLPSGRVDVAPRADWIRETSENEVASFVTETFGAGTPAPALCEYDVAAGTPSVEILRSARERSCDLIVMSSHGLTGARKWLCGSTTERVLRETTVPVLVTPPVHAGPVKIEDASRMIGRIVVPVDLSQASFHQTRVARRLAETFNVPLVLVHVIEPVKIRMRVGSTASRCNPDQRAAAEATISELLAGLPRHVRREVRIVHGTPAEEIARVAHDGRAGLVVMGLNGAAAPDRRRGSITYRVLCLSQTLVLAVPPGCPSRAFGEQALGEPVSSEAIC